MGAAVILVGICLCLGLTALGGRKAEPKATLAEEAWYACTSLVQKQSGYPLIDAERLRPSQALPAGDNVFAVGVNYPDAAVEMQCLVEKVQGGDNVIVM